MASDSVRASSRLLWGAAIGFLVLRLGLTAYQHYFPPKPPGLVHWTPAAQADKVSSDTLKPILYVFSASWSGPSKQMIWEVFNVPDSAEQINRDFVPVYAVEGGTPGIASETEVAELTQRYGVGTYPTLIVVSPDHAPSALRGYTSKDAVEEFLASGWRDAKPNLGTGASLDDIKAELERQRNVYLDGGFLDAGAE
jgi:hypothetical protein